MTDEERTKIRAALTHAYNTLDKYGYNPIMQLIGYLISDDPTYITTKDNARSILSRIDRDDLMEVLLTSFFEKE